MGIQCCRCRASGRFLVSQLRLLVAVLAFPAVWVGFWWFGSERAKWIHGLSLAGTCEYAFMKFPHPFCSIYRPHPVLSYALGTYGGRGMRKKHDRTVPL